MPAKRSGPALSDDGGSPLRLTTDPRGDYNPVWSPDGKWIAFLRGDPASPLSTSDREVRLIAPLGGPERKLADVRVQEITVNTVYLTWCPDSSCLVVTDTTGEGKPDALFVLPLDAGAKRQLTTPGPPVVADTNPAFSADGASLLFLRRTTWAFGELHVLPVRGNVPAGEARHLDVMGQKPDSAAWLPDGAEVVFSAGAIGGGASLWRLPVSGGRPPERLPFVGEDGVNAGGLSRAARPAGALGVCSQLHRRQHLAHRDAGAWRACDGSAGRHDCLDEVGYPPATVS